MVVRCLKCGNQDLVELEQHEVRYFDSEMDKRTTIKTIYTRPMKCLVCNFEFVLPSNLYAQ